MELIKIAREVVLRAADQAGLSERNIYPNTITHTTADGTEVPAWRMTATADQLVAFGAALTEALTVTNVRPVGHVPMDEDWRAAVEQVATLSQRIEVATVYENGTMLLVFVGSQFEPLSYEGEVIVYRSGPSASWRLVGSLTEFAAATEEDAVLAEAARQAIDRPGLVIRYVDEGSLTQRVEQAGQEAARGRERVRQVRQSDPEPFVTDAVRTSMLDNYDA